MTAKTYCLYKHTAPNGKVYIGITSDTPERRWCYGKGYKSNEYFTRAINKYGWERFKHEILFDGLTAGEAEEKEREMISLFKANNSEFGYNITNGGEKGKHHAPSSIEKMREAKRGKYVGELNPRYGKKCSEETKQKISKALKGKRTGEKNPNFGKPTSEEQKRLISKARKGNHYPKLSEAIKKSPACIAAREKMKKPVMRFTRNGEYIKTWPSAPDAAIEICGRRSGQANICSCANGLLKTAYNYVWKYCDNGLETRGET